MSAELSAAHFCVSALIVCLETQFILVVKNLVGNNGQAINSLGGKNAGGNSKVISKNLTCLLIFSQKLGFQKML